MKLSKGDRVAVCVGAVLGIAVAVHWNDARAASSAACVYRQAGALPDRHCTPGATNPAVTQGDIRSTICKPGWTSLVRPESYVMAGEKIDSMQQYGVTGTPREVFEYDHLIPLELGGATNDPRNLWPQYLHRTVKGRDLGARAKDTVENALRSQVCDGARTLRSAQHLVAANWIAVLQ